jgi:hypothetical protein
VGRGDAFHAVSIAVNRRDGNSPLVPFGVRHSARELYAPGAGTVVQSRIG